MTAEGAVPGQASASSQSKQSSSRLRTGAWCGLCAPAACAQSPYARVAEEEEQSTRWTEQRRRPVQRIQQEKKRREVLGLSFTSPSPLRTCLSFFLFEVTSASWARVFDFYAFCTLRLLVEARCLPAPDPGAGTRKPRQRGRLARSGARPQLRPEQDSWKSNALTPPFHRVRPTRKRRPAMGAQRPSLHCPGNRPGRARPPTPMTGKGGRNGRGWPRIFRPPLPPLLPPPPPPLPRPHRRRSSQLLPTRSRRQTTLTWRSRRRPSTPTP